MKVNVFTRILSGFHLGVILLYNRNFLQNFVKHDTIDQCG